MVSKVHEMGNKNPKASSSTTNPKEENVNAPQPQQQPQSPQVLAKSQPQQPLPPPCLEMPSSSSELQKRRLRKDERRENRYALSNLRNHDSARRFSLQEKVRHGNVSLGSYQQSSQNLNHFSFINYLV